jgi:hypothetical protein
VVEIDTDELYRVISVADLHGELVSQAANTFQVMPAAQRRPSQPLQLFSCEGMRTQCPSCCCLGCTYIDTEEVYVCALARNARKGVFDVLAGQQSSCLVLSPVQLRLLIKPCLAHLVRLNLQHTRAESHNRWA